MNLSSDHRICPHRKDIGMPDHWPSYCKDNQKIEGFGQKVHKSRKREQNKYIAPLLCARPANVTSVITRDWNKRPASKEKLWSYETLCSWRQSNSATLKPIGAIVLMTINQWVIIFIFMIQVRWFLVDSISPMKWTNLIISIESKFIGNYVDPSCVNASNESLTSNRIDINSKL